MAKFTKGHKKVGGKTQGVQNKATRDIKEAYRLLIENNLDNLTEWIKQIAKNNPEKAIYILADLSEFVLPKLSRTEAEVTNKIELLQKSVNDLFPPDIIESIKNESKKS